MDVITSAQQEDQRMGVGLVRSAPGARTARHSHANGQTLHVTHGVARMPARAGEIIDVGQHVSDENCDPEPPALTER